MHALLAAAADDRFEAPYVLTVTTGMRLDELLALQWDAIDLEGPSLQVRSSLYLTGHEFIFSQPKTTNSRRRVQLPSIAVEALSMHRRRLLAERLALGAAWQTDYDLVFPKTVGGPMDPSHMVRREFARLLKKAKVPRIRFHDLRHMAATLLFAQGINPKVVSEMLGHSDIAITLSLYGHVTPPMQKQAADAMDQLFDQEV